jgi:inhibitor of Bruton tyrosine kinase
LTQQQLRSILPALKSKELKAFLNSKDTNGNTPLLHAILVEDICLMKLILEYSSDFNVNAQDYESGYTAMHKCLLKGRLKMALLILSKTDVDYKVEDHEGMDCFEMLNVSIKFPKPVRNSPDLEMIHQDQTLIQKVSSCSTSKSLWTWGSNNNYVVVN